MESAIERYLKEEILKINGLALKWVSPGRRGVPDEICFFPATKHNNIVFVELKDSGKSLRAEQIRFADMLLKKFHHKVLRISSKQEVDEFIQQQYRRLKC